MHSAENTGDGRCLTDAPLPFFVRVGLPVCVGIIFATRARSRGEAARVV